MKNEAIKNNTRKMTVCNKGFPRQRGRQYVSFPDDIRLCGKWLLESGFKGGHIIDIVCKNRRLIITLAEEQRFENI